MTLLSSMALLSKVIPYGRKGSVVRGAAQHSEVASATYSLHHPSFSIPYELGEDPPRIHARGAFLVSSSIFLTLVPRTYLVDILIGSRSSVGFWRCPLSNQLEELVPHLTSAISSKNWWSHRLGPQSPMGLTIDLIAAKRYGSSLKRCVAIGTRLHRDRPNTR